MFNFDFEAKRQCITINNKSVGIQPDRVSNIILIQKQQRNILRQTRVIKPNKMVRNVSGGELPLVRDLDCALIDTGMQFIGTYYLNNNQI